MRRNSTQKIICKWRTPGFLFSDNGTEFIHKKFGEFAQKFGIRLLTTPKYYTHANPTERCNRSMKTKIKEYLEKYHSECEKDLDYKKKLLSELDEKNIRINERIEKVERKRREELIKLSTAEEDKRRIS